MRTENRRRIKNQIKILQDVWVLATLTEPDEEMVKMFKMNKMELENLNKKMLASIDERRPDKQYFTLEEYASEFFNTPGKRFFQRISSDSSLFSSD